MYDELLADHKKAILKLQEQVEVVEARVKLNCPGCESRINYASELTQRVARLEADRSLKTEMHDRTTGILDKMADHSKVVDGEVEQMLTRILSLEDCAHTPEQQDKVEKLRRDVVFLMGAVCAIRDDRNCEHEPICLPSSKGPVPIFAVNIADARKIQVAGAEPPIAFAICLCKKCGLPYVFINTLEEAAPFEGGPAPVPTVKPGEDPQ